MSGKYTEAQARATKKYLAEKSEEIKIRVTRDSGKKARWQAAAEAAGKTLSALMSEAMEEKLQRDLPAYTDTAFQPPVKAKEKDLP